ncbi:zona pellucida-like domain-containing protein 1 [Aplochiton taeniatus]
MLLGFLVCQFAWLPLSLSSPNACLSHPTFREPVNTDIDVLCGTDRMEIKVLLCPVYFGGYNESLMAMNAQYTKEECKGSPDWTINPPVLKFNFFITEQAVSVCSNKIKIIEEVGSGFFSDFSSVQSINISGIINSLDPSVGIITYRKEQLYRFSCRYPLHYLVNNTEMSVSGVSLAVKDSNGSFISTLSLRLYSDSSYKSMMQFPDGGVKLKTRIFVEVKATNLTERYNVLLDRCYITTLPYPIHREYFDLFVGCTRDGQTVMGENGLQQRARFSFEAFRFVQNQNMTQSTYYLHCATRLCDRSVCASLVQNCSRTLRRRRDAQETSMSDVATVSSGPIRTRVDDDYPVELEVAVPFNKNGTVLGVAIAAVVVSLLYITLLAITKSTL